MCIIIIMNKNPINLKNKLTIKTIISIYKIMKNNNRNYKKIIRITKIINKDYN